MHIISFFFNTSIIQLKTADLFMYQYAIVFIVRKMSLVPDLSGNIDVYKFKYNSGKGSQNIRPSHTKIVLVCFSLGVQHNGNRTKNISDKTLNQDPVYHCFTTNKLKNQTTCLKGSIFFSISPSYPSAYYQTDI